MFVVLAPGVVTHPSDTSAAAPFSGVFTCTVQGYGYRNIMWHRTNHHLPKKAYYTISPSVNETTSTLTIPNVTSKDVGTYHCVVWVNNNAAKSKSANLILAGKYI